MDRHDSGGGGNTGYTVDTTNLAQRVGELRAVASTVGDLANTLELYGTDIGPGDLGAAMSEYAGDLRSGLAEMNDTIDTIADHVQGAVVAYESVEEITEEEMIRIADLRTTMSVVDSLQQQAGALIAEQEAIVAPKGN